MFAALKGFVESLALADGAAASGDQQSLQLATAALLVEMARMDSTLQAAETDAINAALRERFSLSASEIERLLANASGQAREAAGYYPFTALINRHFGAADKAALVETLWRIAFADGHLDDHEHHFVRKIANLLHVPPSAFIAAKLRARENLQDGGG